jgi:hypothetical protein
MLKTTLSLEEGKRVYFKISNLKLIPTGLSNRLRVAHCIRNHRADYCITYCFRKILYHLPSDCRMVSNRKLYSLFLLHFTRTPDAVRLYRIWNARRRHSYYYGWRRKNYRQASVVISTWQSIYKMRKDYFAKILT